MKFAIVALLVIHGLIHSMGFAGTWGLVRFDGVSRTPTNFLSIAQDSLALRFLGGLWISALVAFVAAAALLATGDGAWRLVAVGAVAISMVPVTLWLRNAPMGVAANALVIAAVLLADRLRLA